MTYSNKALSRIDVEPVSAAELDNFLRASGNLETNDADILNLCITSAREFIEEQIRRPLINTTYKLVMDTLPGKMADLGWWDGVRDGSITEGQADFIELPMAGLQSVTHVKTFSQDNTEATFASSNYFIDDTSTLGRIVLNSGAVWPTAIRQRNGIEVEYVAGYGSLGTDIPGPLRTATLQLATHWYENRELTKVQSDQNQAPAPLHVISILNRYKVMKL